MRSNIEVFLQGDGITDIEVVTVHPTATISDLLCKLNRNKVEDQSLLVFLQDIAGPLDLEAVVEELLPLVAEDDNLSNALRLNFARCRRVEVVVRFNNEDVKRHFPPSATIDRVHHWATRRAFEMTPRDAAEHLLQIQGATVRPDRDVHVGTLTSTDTCFVAFDLVPRKRVEG